jgi:hypothetical protein
MILRLQERAGRATEYTVGSSVFGWAHRGTINPWEIKTLSVTGGKGKRREVKEVNLLER